MTRDKIKAHILTSILGPEQSARVNRIALDTMVPPVGNLKEFLCELAWECGCTLFPVRDDDYIFRVDTSRNLDIELFEQSRRELFIYFTPDEIQAALDKNLAAGLRQLADAIEAGTIDAKFLDCQGNGFTRKGDDRAHLLLRIDLAAEIRQSRLEGESRGEFERDRMGQTGQDNAKKVFGK